MPSNEKRSKTEKVASISFKVLGYVSLLVALGGILIATGTPPGVIGFSIFLPATFLAIPAAILGPGISLFIWHNRQLNFMKALTISMVVTLLIFQNIDWVTLLLFFTYGLVSVSVDTKKISALISQISPPRK